MRKMERVSSVKGTLRKQIRPAGARRSEEIMLLASSGIFAFDKIQDQNLDELAAPSIVSALTTGSNRGKLIL